ncbi:MAG: HD domain-containing protein [Acetatifactor sp.]|nr:HD domain-containing protein [Acetatifactor sp.]
MRLPSSLSPEDEKTFKDIYARISGESRIKESAKNMQHGSTSVLKHSIAVAYTSFYLVRKLKLHVNENALIRGALLHDYFLYDWHNYDNNEHPLHGFFHPGVALRNAMEDFEDLSEVEQDMIKKHMFPLTPWPPKYIESWVLCIADKYCSSKETAEGIYDRLFSKDKDGKENRK